MSELVKVDDGEPVFRWALDMAAKAVDLVCWSYVTANLDSKHSARKSIIAHARTLAKYETPPVDPAELKRWQDAREAAVAIVGYRWIESDKAATLRGESDCEAVMRAYKYFCHRDGVEPHDKAPGA